MGGASYMFIRWGDEGEVVFPNSWNEWWFTRDYPLWSLGWRNPFPHSLFTVAANYLPSWPRTLLFSITVTVRNPSAHYELCRNREIQSHWILNPEETFWVILFSWGLEGRTYASSMSPSPLPFLPPSLSLFGKKELFAAPVRAFVKTLWPTFYDLYGDNRY